jgi:hypothetical protein
MKGQRPLDVSLAPLCKSIERYRLHAEATVPAEGFIDTRLAREIRTYIQRAQSNHQVGFVIGENASGKSTAVQQIEREDHRITQIRVPEGGTLCALLLAIARKRGSEEFNKGDALVLDEGDECFRARGAKTLSFCRRIYDDRAIAVIFIMDPAGYRRLQSVTRDDTLRRLYSRRGSLGPLFLPKFYPEDLDTFAARHGLTPAPDRDVTASFGKHKHTDNPFRVQNEICGSHKDGLFVWLGLLKEASANAAAEKRPVTWEDVLKAHALFTAMETGPAK